MKKMQRQLSMLTLLCALSGCGSEVITLNLAISGAPADTARTRVMAQSDDLADRELDGRRERVPVLVRKDYVGKVTITVQAKNAADCVLADGATTVDATGEDLEAPLTLVEPPGSACRRRPELVVTREGAGSVTSLPEGIACEPTCSARYVEGAQVTLTAAPASGSQFLGWSGACQGAQPTCSVTMTEARAVTARFSPQRYALVLGRDGDGAIRSQDGKLDCGDSCTYAEYEHGARVTLSALPGSKLFFGGWSGDCKGTAPTCEVQMLGPRTVRGRFSPANLVFVTKQDYTIAQIQAQGGGATPDARMVSGADRICNSAANDARLPGVGKYLAFLSTASQSATARIGATGARGWVRPDQLPFGETLSSPVLYPPRMSETKELIDGAVWTGDWGWAYNPDVACDNWTNSGSKFFFVGRSFNGGSRWISDWGWYCNYSARLYCFGTEQKVAIPRPEPQANRRILFVSSGKFDPSAGIAAADQLCNSEADAARRAGKLEAGHAFRAILSTPGAAAAARFPTDNAPYIHRPDGVQVASSYGALMNGTLASFPGLTAMGDHTDAFPFTGAARPNQSGTDATTCRNWQSRAEADLGHYGAGLSAAPSAFDQGDVKCSEPRQVYCLEL